MLSTMPEQLSLFDEPRLLEALYKSWVDARRHKRNTINALKFELDLERNIYQLYEEILYGTYKVSPSICFIVDKPVKREIFAANFRDRVVHHYVINQLMPVFENQFIHDTYSCRVGKGTLFGIRRLQKFIRSCTDNYRKEAFVLKLDIQGFFMNIRKPLLLGKVDSLIERKYSGWDKSWLRFLVRQIILNDPTENCIMKGNLSDWKGLPANKSLFTTPRDCGLPIGNLTSQIFANDYLADFDRFMKETLKLKYYGRYVDDFFVVHEDRNYLKSLVPVIRDYLDNTVCAILHPSKVYLQSCHRGVLFVGAYIAPYRTYPSKRIRHNFRKAMKELSLQFSSDHEVHPAQSLNKTRARVNSYLGFCRHFRAERMSSSVLATMPHEFFRWFLIGGQCAKVEKI